MSRFAANPKWLIYLPPTMAPCETADLPGMLEHPSRAFAYYRTEGVPTVICQEKHMGSRCVLIVCRDREAARRRFGINEDETGICYTRTGRRFFDDLTIEREVLNRLRSAAETAGLWEKLETDWLCLDCELMPWSAKAQERCVRSMRRLGLLRAPASAPLPRRSSSPPNAIPKSSRFSGVRGTARVSPTNSLPPTSVTAGRYDLWTI